MIIQEIIDRIHLIPDSSRDKMIGAISEVKHTKGYLLLQADNVERNIYFIKTGLVRAYINSPDDEITFWFGMEGDTVVSMRSYVDGQPGYENIELLEHCSLYKLNVDALKQLYQEDIFIANWGRRFAEQELLKTEKRLIARQFGKASERYRELIRSHPELLQRVKLSHIASYLGITQVSLSRIRAAVR